MKRKKQAVNMHDRNAMLTLMKQLYGHDGEVKDDQKIHDSKRGTGTKSPRQVAELPPKA